MVLTLHPLQSTSSATLQAVQAICEANYAYYMAVTGSPAPANAAAEFFNDNDLPDAAKGKQRIQLGLFLNGKLVGLADILRNYRTEDTAWLGWLILDTTFQGQGLGRQAYGLVENHVRQWPEITRIMLSVVESNTPALTFWPHLGFADTGERKDYTEGCITSRLHVFTKQL